MNRSDRRRAAAQGLPPPEAVFVATLAKAMAERGPLIRTGLQKMANGGPVTGDHMGQALVSSGAIFVRALENGDMSTAFGATIEVMWLTRALAIEAGKVTETPVADA